MSLPLDYAQHSFMHVIKDLDSWISSWSENRKTITSLHMLKNAMTTYMDLDC